MAVVFFIGLLLRGLVRVPTKRASVAKYTSCFRLSGLWDFGVCVERSAFRALPKP